uniref:Uncharacterized protein n=1 Tax=Amphora coffeiformis TaxID=265554 RepID=A0A7S3LE58_9STRA|eukprot:scaffold568_cov160-Amphora_coffeaeformis.AAC.21
MTSETDLVVAAQALLGLAPPRHEPRNVFRSLAPDASVSTMARSCYPAISSSPVAVSYCSEVSSSGSSVASLDGYASETTSLEHSDNSTTNKIVINKPSRSFSGCISLAFPQDSESLSPLHCFMRKYCVEAFAAEEPDLATPRYGKAHTGRVTLGQVGIRCIHCKHRPARDKQERSVCFPSSLKNIYHSIETWQRRHSLVCRDLPVWIKTSMTELMQKSRAGAGGRRQYWEESARRLGMETTSHGVRFVRVPGDVGLETITEQDEASLAEESPSISVVRGRDKKLVTEYLYMLLEQMESSQFTEQDRAGGRSKVKDCPVGFPGMQCKHCRGKAGFGRYFPTSVQALASANSDRNIFNHIVKCRKCPLHIREHLKTLQKDHASMKNRRGQRKQFFESVWMRLHEQQRS